MLQRVFGRLGLGRQTRRSPERQQAVDEASRGLALYHFEACPYCIRVKRIIQRLDLQIELRDARVPIHQQELHLEGGRYQTPCLRITQAEDERPVQWLYESTDIIRYLKQRFPRT